MNFSLKQLNLERIALIQISASLWNIYDIRALVVEFSNSGLTQTLVRQLGDDMCIHTPEIERGKEWQKIEDRVMENVLQLMLPSRLKEKIVPFIQIVGLQVLKWIEYHRKTCNFDLDLPNEFRWTQHGTIDKKETSKLIIKDESINIATRYKLACFYCIEDDILELWNEMNESDKICLYDDESTKNSSDREYLDFWKYYLIGDLDTFRRKYNWDDSCHEYMLTTAAYNGNKSAVEYFLQRLNPKEPYLLDTALYVAHIRKEYFPEIDTPPKEYLSEILFFLISQMNDEQQMEVFKKYYFKVMCSLLDWPFQIFFVQTANHLLKFLPKDNYHTLFTCIIHKSNLGYKDYAYSELFQDFWQIIPHAIKNCIISSLCTNSRKDIPLWIKHKENLKLVFQNATVIQKHKFIFSERGKSACKDLIFREEWDLLRSFLKLCMSSKDEMLQFKDEFVTYLQEQNIISEWWLDEWCRLLNDLVSGYDKRKCTDENNGDSGPTKRLR